jgi:hypothetical protein
MSLNALIVWCKGPDCRTGAQGRASLAVDGLGLCTRCMGGLTTRLKQLPELYHDCERALGGGTATGLRERTTGGSLPGLPFNEAAAEVRGAILTTLASWSGLVADQRGLSAPRRDATELCAFLVRHARWMAAHPAAAEMTEEVARLVKAAHRVTRSGPQRRIALGACVEAECGGQLVASLSGHAASTNTATIQCDAEPSHRWAGRHWSEILGRVAEKTAAERWFTAQELAWLWSTPLGTVYRMASEQGWRRRKQSGRVYYAEADAHEAFSRRAGRPRQPARTEYENEA